MRTLWIGIAENEVLCNGDAASGIVRRMREGETFPVSEKLVVRAIRRDGVPVGFGLVVVQTSDPMAVLSPKGREQYLWLIESWFDQRGITGERDVAFVIEDTDSVPDAPESWK